MGIVFVRFNCRFNKENFCLLMRVFNGIVEL